MPLWSLLLIYCLAILAASLAGGLIPIVVRLTHRRMEIALSFVSGVMLGVSLLHLLPHALMEQVAARPDDGGHGIIDPVVLWVLGGFLLMFLIERYFCFHHHDAPDDGNGDDPGGGHHHHDHRLTWAGAAVGLTIHTLIAGMALAASVLSEQGHSATRFAGLSTFLVIVLHKPFDSLTIGALMARGRHRTGVRHLVNGLFSLAVPAGAVLFIAGAGSGGGSVPHGVLAAALAVSAGTFLCIALSDLLPELQFHRHDRGRLTVALLLGLALAWGVARLEAGASHDHDHDHDHDGHTHARQAAEELSRRPSSSAACSAIAPGSPTSYGGSSTAL